MDISDTRYVETPDGVYIAYQTAGERPIDLAWVFDFSGNVDLAWECPVTGPLLRALAGSCRVIAHDRRGTGLSSRNVPPSNLATHVSDLRLMLGIGSIPVKGTGNPLAEDAAARHPRKGKGVVVTKAKTG